MLTYLFTLVPLLALDSVWLSVVAKKFYGEQLANIFPGVVVYWPLIIFYPLFALGLVFFAVSPALQSGGAPRAFLLGAFLGLLAYASYELTNQATIAQWPPLVTLVDTLWGGVLSGTASAIAVYLVKTLG